MKKLIVAASVVVGASLLSGCVTTQQDVEAMDNITLAQCAVNGSDVGHLDDVDHLCRKELLKREAETKISPVDVQTGTQAASQVTQQNVADTEGNNSIVGSAIVAGAINKGGF